MQKFLVAFSTLLIIGLVQSDWLATGSCQGGQFTLGVNIINGDCAIMGPDTYRFIQCTEGSYKTWQCSGGDCVDWSLHNPPMETGPLNTCQNGSMSQCFRSGFNETVLAGEFFPTAKRIAMMYTFPQWLPQMDCKGTLQSIAIIDTGVCAKPSDDPHYFTMQCSETTLTETAYSDAKCKLNAHAYTLPIDKCYYGWYVNCFDQK